VCNPVNEVDAYISNFPAEIQERLNAIRKVIQEEAPDASERICMKMPTYDLHGKWLIHFAAFKKHIGLYPQASGVEAFEERLKEFKTSKGTVQFPYKKPLPIDLIREIVRYRVEEQNQKYGKPKG
jgi:uncharacterized protein YdhG (YjbR/CyaY superfamily)